MGRRVITAGQAVADALDFARGAWRGAWAIQLLFAAGLALIFVSLRGRLSTADASDLGSIGWAALLVTAPSLAASLLALRIGGASLRGLGPAGLQLGPAELRLVVLTFAGAGAAMLAWLPVVALSAVVFVAMSGAGMADFPGIGPLRVSFVLAAAVWAAALFLFVYACGRMALAPAATVGKRRLVLVEAWALGKGLTGVLLAALMLASLPTALTLMAAVLLDGIEVVDPVLGVLRTWPVADAAVAGAVFGVVIAFIQAPLFAGVLGAVYCAQRARRTELSRAPRATVHVLRRAS